MGKFGESAHAILEARYGVQILLFLRRQGNPVTTGEIMKALEVSNWYTVPKTLRTLERAGLITMEEGFIGHKRSKAKFWRIEPRFGLKAAEALEEAERWIQEAGKPSGRRAIGGVEPEEKLITIVQKAVKKVTGSG
jgi:DNA-binding HxlR family transcriptional regulator